MPNLLRLALLALLALLLGGCASFAPPAAEKLNRYALQAQFEARAGAALPLSLAVSPPRAHPGFDSPRMVYLRQPYEIQYFARSQWIDTPARMLAPLLVQALERGAGFRAVTPAPAPAAADLRLDTEIVRLQQEFLERPSRVRFTLRAQLTDIAKRRVVATREFDILENAPSEDAYGGVIAANRAVARALAQVAEFCAEQAAADSR